MTDMETLSQYTSDALEKLSQFVPKLTPKVKTSPEIVGAIVTEDALHEMLHRSTSIVRLAGLCGAAAIGFGAYGSHVLREKADLPQRQRIAFETGNRYHLMHSVVLLAAPGFRHPKLSCTLFALGIAMFSGGCYHYALTGEDTVRKITPIGGVTLILAWLSLVL